MQPKRKEYNKKSVKNSIDKNFINNLIGHAKEVHFPLDH
jgi:hypothetical protein